MHFSLVGRAGDPPSPAQLAPVRFADVAQSDSILRTVFGLWRRERVVVACALLAFVLAAACAGVAAARGSWSVPPEGRLLDALKFELGVGIYFLTLAALVPLSGMGVRGRKVWVGTTAVIAVYFQLIEAVQAIRGIDPRFTRVGGTADQVAGAIFGLTAVATIILFGILARRFFRDDVLSDHGALRAGIRYGTAAIAFAFGTGIAMSILSTRIVAETGNLMPLHAAGFHGLQAVPLVALLAGSALDAPAQARLTHAAGGGWLLLCFGLLLQALAGDAVTSLSLGTFVAFAGAGTWTVCLVLSGWAYVRARQTGGAIAPIG